MTRADARRWAAATTLEDLCTLTAQWLAGTIATQPGYYGPVDVDPAPDLREALIALNEAGFLTNSSQEGCVEPSADGSVLYQVAAVTGFASAATTAWLEEVIDETPFTLFVNDCARSPWHRRSAGEVVTWRSENADGTSPGEDYTWFGGQLGRSTIAGELYDGCSRAAIDAVCAARQVTIFAAEPPGNELWKHLLDVATDRDVW